MFYKRHEPTEYNWIYHFISIPLVFGFGLWDVRKSTMELVPPNKKWIFGGLWLFWFPRPISAIFYNVFRFHLPRWRNGEEDFNLKRWLK